MANDCAPPAPNRDPGSPRAGSLSERITQNIASVEAMQRREWDATPYSHRRVERVSRLLGHPAYLAGLMAFAVIWIVWNEEAQALGFTPFDKPPFAWLQGLLTLVALITTTIVLIAQNRQLRLEQQRAHLDLQVNLLTEQKVTKVIHLIEELRRDLPMVKDRHDPQSEALQERADTVEVVAALNETGLTKDSGK